MSRIAGLPSLVTKEIRGLFGVWLACIVAIVIPVVPGVRAFRGLGIGAYFLGSAALGALSIGHEYSHRTLTLLLSQPARRERLLLVKLGVLATMLLTLAAVAVAAVDFPAPVSDALPFVLLPILGGLFVAPWLTMLCRSPIAGTVFTLALPGLLLVASELLYVATYGRAPAWNFQMAVVWRGSLGLCAVGAVMTWRTFMRLEAIDGPGPVVQLPQWLRRQTTTSATAPVLTKRHPVWLLVKKELRLQQMALAVAGLYVLGWLALVSFRPLVAHLDDVFTALTFLYGASIPMLIGSLASAEERQLGTIEWQALLPVATSKQWAVKVGTVLGLALLLALGLPALLASIPSAADIKRFPVPQFAAGVAVLTVVSLYVSTLCTSGLRAMLMSVPAIFAVVLFVSRLAEALVSSGRVLFLWGTPVRMTPRMNSEQSWQRLGMSPVDFSRFMTVLELLLVTVVLAVVLRFALANHRSADRGAGNVWRQGIVMAVCLLTGTLVLVRLAEF